MQVVFETCLRKVVGANLGLEVVGNNRVFEQIDMFGQMGPDIVYTENRSQRRVDELLIAVFIVYGQSDGNVSAMVSRSLCNCS